MKTVHDAAEPSACTKKCAGSRCSFTWASDKNGCDLLSPRPFVHKNSGLDQNGPSSAALHQNANAYRISSSYPHCPQQGRALQAGGPECKADVPAPSTTLSLRCLVLSLAASPLSLRCLPLSLAVSPLSLRCLSAVSPLSFAVSPLSLAVSPLSFAVSPWSSDSSRVGGSTHPRHREVLQGKGSRVFRVWGLRFRVQSSEFREQGQGNRGSELRVKGTGVRN